MLDGDPCSILENEFVKPGKGQAFNRVKLRNLKSGRVWERTFKSGDTLEGADVMDVDLEYSYTDGEFWHFMDPSTYEQYGADQDAVGESEKWPLFGFAHCILISTVLLVGRGVHKMPELAIGVGILEVHVHNVGTL